MKKPTVQAPIEASQLDGSYVVYAYGVKRDALNVSFPTWTAYNGNDDLAIPLVPGEKVSDGIWKAVVPFNKHNNETRIYYNDVWVDGVYFGGSHTLVKRNNVQIPAKVNFKDGSYEVIVEGIHDDISKVTFYTWTEANGQDDLKQMSGQKISSGVWKVSIPLSEHNYETGIYTTHIYTTDLLGNSTGIGVQTEITKSIQAPTEANLLDGSYVVYAYGVKRDALNVTFPTWTAYNGNDDLAIPLVPGEKVSDGIWKAVVPFNKHNNETGIYYNDVWVDGVYFGGSHTLVKRNNVQIPAKVNFKDGSYEVIVEGIRDDISKVTFYTWTEANGQDDLKQMSGQKISSGVWKISIPLSEHNNETGIYTTHIYTTDLLGNSTGIGVQTEITK
ncbi:GBS Bsp-like repeat-containing protein [Paenibacillus tritici]|uniref:GBS Bsp-like repeat-containing protein n=1 Tax=Paenibacillus tritici TaxID=1873425 RepID=UPI001BA84458|nr:GBS Bsp-like repeat-containing protein [Paenibacillus tritici]QUL56301.1 GBS Bsp-like repeat-containing protein [Paenibacillus tritici]